MCSVICASRTFSSILDIAGRTLIGRKFLGWIGLETFGIGVIIAFFQFTGKDLASIMVLKRWERTGRIKGHRDLMKEIGISSTPVAFVWIS